MNEIRITLLSGQCIYLEAEGITESGITIEGWSRIAGVRTRLWRFYLTSVAGIEWLQGELEGGA